METVVVTGASGLLGANVVTVLLASGCSVRAIRRPSSDTRHLAHLPINWHGASFEHASELAKSFEGAGAVIHCAGATVQSRWLRPELQQGNIVATRNVVEACRRARVHRLIHCSSTVTCGFSAGVTPVSQHQADLAAPPWPDGYFTSKCAAEAEALKSGDGLEVVVVNPGFLIGPLDPGRSSGRLILLGLRGHALGWTVGCNNFVDVRDVSAGIVAALQHGRAGERYILGGQNLSYRDLLSRVAVEAGHRPPSFPIAYPFAAAAGRLGDAFEAVTGRRTDLNSVTVHYAYAKGLRYTSEKAARELGYRVRPIDETINSAIDWFRRADRRPGTR